VPALRPGGAHMQGPTAAAPPPQPKKDDDAEDDSKFDEFMGSDTALLAGTTGEYDKDDKEADEIWAHVDDFMDDRRRVRLTVPVRQCVRLIVLNAWMYCIAPGTRDCGSPHQL
jgi:PRP1 splicing factor, N-terminal